MVKKDGLKAGTEAVYLDPGGFEKPGPVVEASENLGR
jgi:hypothetical protein